MRDRIHVSLDVADLDASTRFYSALFGAEPSKRREAYANYRLDTPALMLALVEHTGQPVTGSGHLGVELLDADALPGWRSRLTEAGVLPFEQTDTECCYARGDKLWVTDPDGHRWEIFVRTGDSEHLQEPEQRCCA